MADSATGGPDPVAQEPPDAGGEAIENLGSALQKYQQGRDSVTRLKNARIALSIMLVLVIVGYLMAFYAAAKSMWDPENFKEPMTEELQRLKPSIRNAAQNAVERVKPVYMNRVREAFTAIRPHLAQRVKKEWEAAAPGLSAAAKREIKDALTRVYYRQNEELKKHFPNLEDETRRELLRKRFEESLRKDIDAILVDFETMYVRDMRKVERTIQKFRPNRYERFTEEEIGRYYVHLWVSLLDYHLMESFKGGN